MYDLTNRRYTGSKTQLTDWIMQLANEHCPGESFFDVFAGTGVVADRASKFYKDIYVNDFLPSNYATYQAFLGKGRYSERRIEKTILQLNGLNPEGIDENYFSISYGDKYFSHANAKKIGHIREYLEEHKEEFSPREYWILITSLMFSADKIANTVGHYDAFFQKVADKGDFLIKPIKPKDGSQFKLYCEDSNKLVRKIKADVAYIDPPYNSRQYSRFYHVLDNLVTWEKPELFGVARKPAPVNMSDYSKTSAKRALEDLISNLDCKYIMVSYNNTYNPKSNSSKNKISFEEITDILSKRGETLEFSKSHKHFNAGNTKFDDHKEYVFITKVK